MRWKRPPIVTEPRLKQLSKKVSKYFTNLCRHGPTNRKWDCKQSGCNCHNKEDTHVCTACGALKPLLAMSPGGWIVVVGALRHAVEHLNRELSWNKRAGQGITSYHELYAIFVITVYMEQCWGIRP